MALIEDEAAKLNRMLRRSEAANYITQTYGIPCSPKTLAKLACIGGGPPFRLAGRFPLYPVSGLGAGSGATLVKTTIPHHRSLAERMAG